MSSATQRISVKGKQQFVPAVPVGDTRVIISGRWPKIASIHDEFWTEPADLPAADDILDVLRHVRPRPDLFTFAQQLPDVSPRFPFHLEWDNYAVAHIDSYQDWFDRLVDRSVRKHIRKAVREGVVAKVAPFTDELVAGICDIYNELPVRQGKPFWHYGKPHEVVKTENSTYLDRSVFIGAYYGEELVGFLKLVVSGKVAGIMQILAKASHFNRRPMNALIAKAVEVVESRGLKHLVYDEFVYGKKYDSSLLNFKRNNGFVRVDVPRYYVPLTVTGRVCLACRLHRDLSALVPAPVISWALAARGRWQTLRV